MNKEAIKTAKKILQILHAGPAAWNSLPEHVRVEADIRVFRKLLKTHLFNLALTYTDILVFLYVT